MKNRFTIKISFKGTAYQGWQAQPGKFTVQGVLGNALKHLLKEDICLTGAGRTDSGVHAFNYIAHFDSEKISDKDGPGLTSKLNRFLPKDILVHGIAIANPGFHSRYDAISRTYHYLVSQSRNPFLDEYSLFYPKPLDLEAMRAGCLILLKNDDFTSFSKLHGNNKTTICVISDCDWKQIQPGLLIFRITSDRFLRNMVRAIVGTMIRIGTHKIQAEDLQAIIDSKDRSSAGSSVAAKGLFLTEIKYSKTVAEGNGLSLFNENFFF